MSDNVLATMAAQFAMLSLFSVGGANAAIPDMQRISVDMMHWMTAKQFTDAFAIAQMSPGPNVIIVALIGYHVAGAVGAGVATLAMVGPSCALAFIVARVWDRFKHARWRVAVQAGLVPLSLGLIAASAFIIARTTDHNAAALAVTAATAVVAYMTRLNPLWLFAAGGVIGFAGLI